MDVIQMYCSTDMIRQYINTYNLQYTRQNVAEYVKNLTSFVREAYKIGVSDPLYWDNTEIDFQKMYVQIQDIEEAVEAEDFVGIYDILNGEIWKIIKCIFEVLFNKNGLELREFFWKDNYESLMMRYPDIAKQIEQLPMPDINEGVRPYGIRGRVIYRKTVNKEYNLYSAFDPGEVAFRLVGRSIVNRIDKYKKIFIWGCNGGFEINGIKAMAECQDTDLSIETYITDLNEFKMILMNTPRRGALMDASIEWKFNTGVKEFIKKFPLYKKNELYIYISNYTSECYDEELYMLKEFIVEHLISSNVGDLL